MNVYEKKFKECYNILLNTIELCHKNLKECEDEMAAYVALEKSFKDLKENKNTSKAIIDALQSVVDANAKRKGIIREELVGCRHAYTNHLKEKQFMDRHLCPHEETEFDSEDYHKGVNIFRCKLCGSYLR
jgi:hypothetical protein